MWTHHTIHGLWTIGEHDGKVILLFNGEWLLEARSPHEILYLVNKGYAKRPLCGPDPTHAGLPTSVSAWTKGT